MKISEEKKRKIKKEIKYLSEKKSIESFVDAVGYENILRHMLDELDNIEDINNTRTSVYLFQLIASLEKALEIYPRIKHG